RGARRLEDRAPPAPASDQFLSEHVVSRRPGAVRRVARPARRHPRAARAHRPGRRGERVSDGPQSHQWLPDPRPRPRGPLSRSWLDRLAPAPDTVYDLDTIEP